MKVIISVLNIVGFIIIGLSLGWMVGLSVSPVLQVVVSSIITFIVSVVSVLVGFTYTNGTINDVNSRTILNKRINILPLALFVLSTAIGVSFGIYNRTNERFGLYPDNLINRWSEDSITRERMKVDLFKKMYIESNEESKQKQFTAGLFSVTVDDCGSLISKKGEDLRASLIQVSNGQFDSLIKSCDSDTCLNSIRDIICKGR
jgi:hypothetical protein